MIYLAEHQPPSQFQTHDHYLEQLAAIHIMKRDLNLDDEQYRNILESITGYRSSKDMSPMDRERVIGYLTALLDLADWTAPRCINYVKANNRAKTLRMRREFAQVEEAYFEAKAIYEQVRNAAK